MPNQQIARPKSPAYRGFYGPISKDKLEALVELRAIALDAIRRHFRSLGATEVTPASLVNVAGSCENPYASFPLVFYGGEAFLSQSAQLQLEPLVIRLRRGFFCEASSFRAEDYEDPESPGRRLSEFTLSEIEIPFDTSDGQIALNTLMDMIESTLRFVLKEVLVTGRTYIERLGGSLEKLDKTFDNSFARISWREARRLVGLRNGEIATQDDLSMRQEQAILASFDHRPVFITQHPAQLKFFNTKRLPDEEFCLSADLLLSPLGESVGGAIREERALKLKTQLQRSDVANFIRKHGGDPAESFRAYFEVVETEPPLPRGGFGLGFERLLSFITNSNDIIEAIRYREVAALNR
jgi:asparaginyl-tRNA synthetase